MWSDSKSSNDMVAALRRSKGRFAMPTSGYPPMRTRRVLASLDMAEGLDLLHVGVLGTVGEVFPVNLLRPLLSKLCTLDFC